MNGLNWQTLQLPFAAGLDQQSDDRARQPPALEVCKDVQFDELGGLQTRLPYAALGSSIFGGGTISDARRLFVNGDELLLFTKSNLYSWNDTLGKWLLRGTHLAVKVEGGPVYVTTGDQIDCDRAELSNTVMYAWTETSTTYVAAQDKQTGAVLMAPTAIAGYAVRPRLIALTTKILCFFHDNLGNLLVYGFDPADPSAAFAGVSTTVLGTNSNYYYDAAQIIGSDSAIVGIRRLTTTSYSIVKVTAALAITAATKARTCDGPIAVSSDPTGATVQVIRANGTSIQGDQITVSSLADAATAQAVGTVSSTPVSQIAAAHRSVQDSGAYRCYAFWTSDEGTDSTEFLSKSNYVDTAGTIGTQAQFVVGLGVASRAFDYDGRVFIWGAFGGRNGNLVGSGTPLGLVGQFQNSYFLYRDDAHLTAKAIPDRAGGLNPTVGHLSGVALVSGSTGYAWCGVERRVITIGVAGGTGGTGYADRGPVDVLFTFDSAEARRCARLGSTLYVAGGEILQYDGIGLYEVGFHVYPWFIATDISTLAGSIPAGAYSYKTTLRWQNARGEQERSTTATGEQVTLPSSKYLGLVFGYLHITHKTVTGSVPAVEIWRTEINPSPESPYYLTTSNDPAVLSGNNRYVPNDYTWKGFSTVGLDDFTDAILTTKESDPETDGVLESLAPPPATIIAASDTRIFLAGVTSDPDRVWYSRLRGGGQVASFHDALTIDIPRDGGDITALAILNTETLIVFRETSIVECPGYGLDNLGQGQNYGPVRIISSDVGAISQETVALTPAGLVFKSSKGWYLLSRGLALQYIGGAVSDYDTDSIVAVHVLENQHHVRCVSTSRMLAFDYLVNQWSEWTVSDGLHAGIWRGKHIYLAAAGPKTEQSTHTSLTYGLDVETAWIKLADLQGAGSVRRLLALGEFRSPHYVRVRVAYNYSTTFTDDKSWLASPTTTGGPLQIQHATKRPKCESIKVRLTAVAASTILTASGLSGTVTLSVATWAATLTSVVPRTVSVCFEDGVAASVEVRDNEIYSAGAWSSQSGNCGVKVVSRNTTAPIAIATIEAAINATSTLVQVTSAHATPSATVDATAMAGLQRTGTFPVAYPAGEALKLTGLGLEIGIEQGLFRRLPPAQRQ